MHTLVIDWGIGGVDSWARLRTARPDWSTTYVSDAGFTPWGRVDAASLAQRLQTLIKAVALRATPAAPAPDVVVVACNAMSTVLDAADSPASPTFSALGLPLGTPTFGIIAPAISHCLTGPWRSIAIIGGQRTIDAAIHATALVAAGRIATAVVAQPLSAHVEAGRLSGPEVERDIAAIIARIIATNPTPDALLLACTHYPALSAHFRSLLPATTIIDPVEALLADIFAWSTNLSTGRNAPAPQPTIMTSGDPHTMRTSAKVAFGVDLNTPIERLPAHPTSS